tara:strand:- start:1525 stop:1890 length:366 start_codon:yes stop_codon:yes gene_type:complete
MKVEIKIKPLSVNQAWQGRRFKTPAYKKYEKEMLRMLKPEDVPEGELAVMVEIGFANKASDIDNPLKPLLDILSKKYGFNDNKIYSLLVRKKIVKKGEEYIKVEIESAIVVDAYQFHPYYS